LQKIGKEGSAKESPDSASLQHAELAAWLSTADTPEAEIAWQRRDPIAQHIGNSLLEMEVRRAPHAGSRLYRLIGLFGLNAEEQKIIETILALHLDPNLGRVYAYLQDHSGRTYVSRPLVARLFQTGRTIRLGASSSLFSWQLVTETEMGKGEPSRLDLDPFVRNWLLGSDDLDLRLANDAHFLPIHPSLEDWPVSKTARWINQVLNKDPLTHMRILVTGNPESGRKSFAAALCSQFQFRLLLIQTEEWRETDWPMLFLFAQRQSLLLNQAIVWEGKIPLEKSWPAVQRQFPLQFCIGEPGETLAPSGVYQDLTVLLPGLRTELSLKIWNQYLPAARNWPRQLIQEMMLRQQPTIGQLMAVVKSDPQDIDEAGEAFQQHARHRMGPLAQILSSSFTWDDLVVPVSLRENLDDFYYEATERAKVWEDPAIKRLFPMGRGLIALFNGVPGTGKTMAAQVIARSLHLDLYRINLSAVVSKYVGETSKNMEKILSCAATLNLVLLFDEADALFAKRTEMRDAHDRFANTDTNYLLQAIESYPGIAILATNKKTNIDSGFIRRLRFVLDFPKPDAEQRLTIWKKIIEELSPGRMSESMNRELKSFSDMLELTGAQIKFSVLSALYLARKEQRTLSIRHLLKGVERELLKEGKGIGRQGQEILKSSHSVNDPAHA